MTKVVLDINVFISSLFWEGVPCQIFKKVLKGQVPLKLDTECILRYPENI